jgi:dienelactone hydrolase
MKRAALICMCALGLGAPPCYAQPDLGFPSQPEREVKVPGRAPVAGAHLYAPEGTGPFPAVVLSHPSGRLQQHMFQWAKRFLAAGYVALVVDHLSPRGKNSNLDHSISVTEYAEDDVAALKHLRTLPFVDGKRVAQMGFSYGAMAGLREASGKFRGKQLGGERFAAIVSVYPWCNQQGGPRYQDHQWNFFDDTDLPLLVIVGLDDDEANPRSCVDQAHANAAKGLPVELIELPGTTHAFDHTWMGDKPVVEKNGNNTITYRYNRESVEATWKAASEFLARIMGPPLPR